MAKGSKSKTKKSGSSSQVSEKVDDFILTISDDEPMPIDEESEAEPEVTTKKSKKAKQVEKSGDIDSDFEFEFEGIQSSTFKGWDLDTIAEAKGADRKDVDLDAIIKGAGGLESEEENEEDDEEEEEPEAFMGLQAESEEDDESDEEDAEEGETKEEDEDEEYDNEGEEPEGDTAEEEARYFAAPEEEAAVHKDFQSLPLSKAILRGLTNFGFTSPTPIQSKVIPIALRNEDIVAGAVTGSGKTAAYIVPVLERFYLLRKSKIQFNCTRVIVICPTRELAAQVCDVGRKLTEQIKELRGLRFGLAAGGFSLREQEQVLKTRPDVVVATPGRLIDFIRNLHSFSVDTVEILVLDEADRLLDDGFENELNEILSLLPTKRQTMLFSATMNSRIQELIRLSLRKPRKIMVNPPKQAAARLTQEFIRIRDREDQRAALLYYLLKEEITEFQPVMVFVQEKRLAHELRIVLGLLNKKVGELHGWLTQEQRLRAVSDFKNKQVSVLICSDVAARGLDIPKVEVVINYNLPQKYETYLHRVGRTARAGKSGRSISFVGERKEDRIVANSARKSVEASKTPQLAKVLHVDWDKIAEVHTKVEANKAKVEEILIEEKQQKQFLQAEREIQKSENLLNHREEILSRPKRTWFETEKDKKKSKDKAAAAGGFDKSNKKRKIEKERDLGPRSYKKTAKDRSEDRAKPPKGKSSKAANGGGSGKSKGKGKRGKK